MSKRVAPGLLNMVKRLRFSVDDMDVYLKPEPPHAFSDKSLEHSKSDNKQIMEDEDESTKPSPIQYQEGFPKLLFQDMQSSNPNVVLNAAVILEGMLGGPNASNEKLHKEFLMLGGHSTLITAMQKWSKNGVIQSHLCRCIAGLVATHNDTANEDSADLVAALLLMGALDQITMGALMQHPKFPSIQLDAMLAVTHLCGGNSMEILPSAQDAAQRFVRELNGVSLVAKTMRVFAGIEDVQEAGCHLFSSLCHTGDHEEADVIKGKALMVVASSAQSYPDNPNIEKDAHDLMNAVLSRQKTEEELD